jgi:hypothetical protein
VIGSLPLLVAYARNFTKQTLRTLGHTWGSGVLRTLSVSLNALKELFYSLVPVVDSIGKEDSLVQLQNMSTFQKILLPNLKKSQFAVHVELVLR